MYDCIVATICLLGLLDVVSVPLPVMMGAVVVYLYSKVVTG
jgi:hypothetical protein